MTCYHGNNVMFMTQPKLILPCTVLSVGRISQLRTFISFPLPSPLCLLVLFPPLLSTPLPFPPLLPSPSSPLPPPPLSLLLSLSSSPSSSSRVPPILFLSSRGLAWRCCRTLTPTPATLSPQVLSAPPPCWSAVCSGWSPTWTSRSVQPRTVTPDPSSRVDSAATSSVCIQLSFTL